MKGIAIAAAALACAIPAVPRDGSAAGAKPQPRDDLVQLYTLSVVLDTCSGVDVSDDDENKLDAAISAAEGKLALTLDASQALYHQLLASADRDNAAFCAKYVPVIKASLDKLPN